MRQTFSHSAAGSAQRKIAARLAIRNARLKRAFTLIEVLVAGVILSIALLAFVSATAASRNAVDRGNHYAVAAAAIAAKYADLQGGGYVGFGGHGSTTTYTVSNLPKGSMTVWVTYLDNSGWNSGMPIWQIDITVSWSAGGGQGLQSGGSIHQSTYITQRR